MKFILQPNEGERVLLGAPLCGEILVKTDPAIVGGQMVMVVQTLPPGGVIPVHRYSQHPLFIWVAKGQGRVTVEDHQHTVVPGNAVVVPTGQWYGLRNTGTGLFQIVWVAPASLLAFFRSEGQAAQPLDQAALQTLAQAHGIEFQSAEAQAASTVAPQPRRHGRRFHRRDRNQPRANSASPQSAQQASGPAVEPVASAPVSQAISTPVPIVNEPEVIQSVSSRPERRYPNRNRGRRPNRQQAPQSTAASPKTSEGPSVPPSRAPAPKTEAPAARRAPSRRPPGRYGRHFKEVFMNGRWVKVSGEGPTIASGD